MAKRTDSSSPSPDLTTSDSARYERFADAYAADTPPPWDSGIVPPEVRALVEGDQLLTPGRALDVGCGTGLSSVYLAQHGWRVTGLDWIETALEQARARAGRATPEQALELESRTITAYHRALGELRDERLLAPLAAAMANHGQHVVVLRQALGRDPLPGAFAGLAPS